MKGINHFVLIYFMFAFILFTHSGCKKELAPAEYASWVKSYENGYHKKKQVSNITFDVQYKPHPYIVLQESQGKQLSREEMNQRLKQISGSQYYDLRITSSEEEDLNAKEKLYYLSFRMQQDIVLVENTDTLPCLLYHFERSYDLTPSKSFVFAFQKQGNEESDKTLIINSEILGTGPVKIRFSKKELNNLPTIKTER